MNKNILYTKELKYNVVNTMDIQQRQNSQETLFNLTKPVKVFNKSLYRGF